MLESIGVSVFGVVMGGLLLACAFMYGYLTGYHRENNEFRGKAAALEKKWTAVLRRVSPRHARLRELIADSHKKELADLRYDCAKESLERLGITGNESVIILTTTLKG